MNTGELAEFVDNQTRNLTSDRKALADGEGDAEFKAQLPKSIEKLVVATKANTPQGVMDYVMFCLQHYENRTRHLPYQNVTADFFMVDSPGDMKGVVYFSETVKHVCTVMFSPVKFFGIPELGPSAKTSPSMLTLFKYLYSVGGQRLGTLALQLKHDTKDKSKGELIAKINKEAQRLHDAGDEPQAS